MRALDSALRRKMMSVGKAYWQKKVCKDVWCDLHHAICRVVAQTQFRPRLQFILLEVTGIGFRLSHGSYSEPSGELSVRLSNTQLTCPKVGYNLGKLRLIPHRRGALEGPPVQSGRKVVL